MRFHILVFLFFQGFWCHAQQNVYLRPTSKDGNNKIWKEISYKKELIDSNLVVKECEKIILQLQSKGYFLAAIDTIQYKNNQVNAIFNTHQAFQWLKLSQGNIPTWLQQRLNYKESQFNHQLLNVNQLQNLFHNILSICENNGFPFANVQLDSVAINLNQVSAKLKIIPNQQIIYDSIKVVGTAQIATRYLQNHLSIIPNKPYQEYIVKQINTKLSELSFLQITQNPEIKFNQAKANILVYANKKDANQFDGIIGFQQKGNTGKVEFVGDLKLNLNNSFKRGEQIAFNYRGFAKGSQMLDLTANIPNIFNTNFGIVPGFQLFKQDSLYLNTNSKLSFNYNWKNKNGLDLTIENRSTSLIATDSYSQATALPAMLDANTLFYGIGIHLENIDYRPNPRKGYYFNIDAAVGSRQIKKNTAIPINLYQNINLKSTAYQLFSKTNLYVPFSKDIVLALENQNATLTTGGQLLENETFRLGGQKILRGFNELSISASRYIYGNIELRYLMETNSNLFIFYNQAFLQYKTIYQNIFDNPLGIGVGINMETNLGILSLSYALGKQRNIPLNLRQGKIHFGISTTF